jgi:hypothetical protein
MEIQYVGEAWLIAEWPDGDWCELAGLDACHPAGLSEEYAIRRVVTFDPNGYIPMLTIAPVIFIDVAGVARFSL